VDRAAQRPPRPLVAPAGPVARWFAGALVGFVARMSRPTLRWWARFVGGLAWTLRIRRAVTLDNLRHAFPELAESERRRIARGAYENMALAALESFTAAGRPASEVDGMVRFANPELLDRAIADGKGVLVATAHLGSWELLGSVMARRGVRLHAVVRPLRGALNERIVRSRQESGLQLIAARGALRGILRAIGKGEVVVMLLDQVMPADQGVFVPFFGRPASTSPGLSAAARRTGAPVLFGVGVREGDGIVVHLEGPFPVSHSEDAEADLRAHVAAITAALERWIRRYPDQWLWLHRRWKVQPDQMSSRSPSPT
jgi:Kdo2-lipid IVA lauroyltransferase/acyltransferase